MPSARMEADESVRFGPRSARLPCWPCRWPFLWRGLLTCRRSATSMRTPIRSAPTPSSARRTSIRATPYANIFATTPGLEQQARRSTVHLQWPRAALLQFQRRTAARAASRATRTRRNSARCWACRGRHRCFDLPFRFTANVRAEVDRFTQVPRPTSTRSRCRPACSTSTHQRSGLLALHRLCAAMGLYAILSATGSHTRQDLNVGVNKIIQLRRRLPTRRLLRRHVGQTVWSFGVTTFIQRRFRDPAPGSWAAIRGPVDDLRHLAQVQLSARRRLERRAFDSY